MLAELERAKPKQQEVWRPQRGPQEALVKCPFREVFFGGARGGGKTDGVLGHWALKEKRYGKDFNAIMFRRTTVSSEDAIERSKEIYGLLGGKFNESKAFWRMPNGGRVSFRYLEREKDAEEWQGRNVTDAWVEEAGQYPLPGPIDRLFGVLRSAKGVPTQLILTANPGGAGQNWIKTRYRLVPFPKGPKVHDRLLPNGETHRYAVIPSRITDNKILLEGDPQYINNLYMVGSAELVRGWLDGDWTAVSGAFFDCWDEKKHVVRPFQIPSTWTRFRSIDWGSAKPFSVGWWVIVDDPFRTPEGNLIPRGAIVRYREWYGAKQENGVSVPNVGLKLTAEQVAAGIIERENGEKIIYGVLDPAAFHEDGGPSIAERMMQYRHPDISGQISVYGADNKRVAQRGAMGGWDAMRHRFVGEGGVPMIYCFSTCVDSIRTIPVLQHDETRAEDLDTDSEDHAADEWRYACMSRPWVPAKPEITINNLSDYTNSYSDDDASESWKTV